MFSISAHAKYTAGKIILTAKAAFFGACSNNRKYLFRFYSRNDENRLILSCHMFFVMYFASPSILPEVSSQCFFTFAWVSLKAYFYYTN